MSKKKFNPKEWEIQPATGRGILYTPKTTANVPIAPIVPKNDIETITQRIETTATDIAPNYADWRDLGFALADALGESGRNYYHRLSCFYPKTTQPKQTSNLIIA